MMITLAAVLALTACAEPVAFRPVPVETPVPVPATPPAVPQPPDLMAALMAQTGLAEAMKTCLRQTLLDRVFQAELEAALQACRS
jgi:hypothetical protein